jgi:hypothetical protein
MLVRAGPAQTPLQGGRIRVEGSLLRALVPRSAPAHHRPAVSLSAPLPGRGPTTTAASSRELRGTQRPPRCLTSNSPRYAPSHCNVSREVGRGLPRYVERDFARYLEGGPQASLGTSVPRGGCRDGLPARRTARAPPGSSPPSPLCSGLPPHRASELSMRCRRNGVNSTEPKRWRLGTRRDIMPAREQCAHVGGE